MSSPPSFFWCPLVLTLFPPRNRFGNRTEQQKLDRFRDYVGSLINELFFAQYASPEAREAKIAKWIDEVFTPSAWRDLVKLSTSRVVWVAAEMERFRPQIIPIATRVAEKYADENFTQSLQKLGLVEADPAQSQGQSGQQPSSQHRAPKAIDGTLALDFKPFLKSPDLSDMHFLVEGERIPAHRVIVASRSSHFNSSLQSGMRETTEGEVVLSDVSLGCFNLLLEYFYGGVDLANAEIDHVTELLQVCEEYNLPSLKAMCGELLRTHVDVENAASLLSIADSAQAASLKNIVLEYIAENPEVDTTEEFLALEPRLQEEAFHTRLQYQEVLRNVSGVVRVGVPGHWH